MPKPTNGDQAKRDELLTQPLFSAMSAAELRHQINIRKETIVAKVARSFDDIGTWPHDAKCMSHPDAFRSEVLKNVTAIVKEIDTTTDEIIKIILSQPEFATKKRKVRLRFYDDKWNVEIGYRVLGMFFSWHRRWPWLSFTSKHEAMVAGYNLLDNMRIEELNRKRTIYLG